MTQFHKILQITSNQLLLLRMFLLILAVSDAGAALAASFCSYF